MMKQWLLKYASCSAEWAARVNLNPTTRAIKIIGDDLLVSRRLAEVFH